MLLPQSIQTGRYYSTMYVDPVDCWYIVSIFLTVTIRSRYPFISDDSRAQCIVAGSIEDVG